MSGTPDNDELKAINDAIQAETDPKRLSALVDRMLKALDAKEKKTPEPVKEATQKIHCGAPFFPTGDAVEMVGHTGSCKMAVHEFIKPASCLLFSRLGGFLTIFCQCAASKFLHFFLIFGQKFLCLTRKLFIAGNQQASEFSRARHHAASRSIRRNASALLARMSARRSSASLAPSDNC